MIKQMIKTMPDQCTYFNYIRVDEKGLIYVFVPDLADRTRQHIDIFSPEGKYLYKAELSLPDGFRFSIPPTTFKDNYLYVFAEDPDGEGMLIKYRVKRPSL
jgi:hypothetical protein